MRSITMTQYFLLDDVDLQAQTSYGYVVKCQALHWELTI